ncbi:hypothetical protein [Shimazuella alba]|uniref:Uncharacterized protein n=1 Tax=Shimazuella alba TaxID=2690964 RepID=A0A6I4VTX7_9BACL|nr:hypothetical protein [Shimazuella alba]MXQ55239.1 hypothetical protein [Shimazuella alba]
MYVIALGFLTLIGCTTYVVILTHQHKKSLTLMTGMMISMGIAMLSSLLLGTILGMLIGKMFGATEIAIIIGMAVGFLTGKPIHLIASLDGVLAGIMGGMMGAMLGVMIQTESPIITLAYLIIVFKLSCILIIFLIRKEVLENKSPEYQEKIALPNHKFFLTILLGYTILLLIAIYFHPILPTYIDHSDHMHM